MDDRALLAFSIAGDRYNALSMAYEFDAACMLRQLGYHLPLWMSQGTGEVLSGFELHDGHADFGDSPERFIYPLDHERPIKWERFFEIFNDSPEYSGPDAKGVYQAQAWGLMRVVLMEGASPRARFLALAEKVRATRADQEAVAAVIGCPPNELMARVMSHINTDWPIRLPIDDAGLRAQLRVGPAPEAEVDVQLAELLAAAGKTTRYEDELESARALAPGAACVKEALARREARHNNPSAAAQLYREAIAAGSVSPRAYLMSASDRINESTGGVDQAGVGGFNIADAISEIHRALQLSPGNTDAYLLLARAFFVAPKVSAADIDELAPALNPGPDGQRLRLYRALLYARISRTEESVADLKEVLGNPQSPAEVRRIATDHLRRAAFAADSRRVERLANAGQFDQARAVIDEALGRNDSLRDPDAYNQLRSRVNEFEAVSRMKSFHHSGDWARLRDAAQFYLDNYPAGRFAHDAAREKRIAENKLHSN